MSKTNEEIDRTRAENTAGNEHTEDIIEKIDESSDEEIKNPFDPTEIDMNVKPLIIDSLIKRMRGDKPRIDLNTEFQRRGNLWNEKAQSRLIESLLVRIPIPAFYFDGTNDDLWKVVDGLQRLTTLYRFIIEESLNLQNLEFLKQYNGLSFSGLPPHLQGRIEETQITVYIINPGTPDDVKYNIFKRINTGGLTLNPQEIRHALNQGVPADFIKKLAAMPEFHLATHDLLRDHKRMEDRDFVTRFVAFFSQGYENYQSDQEYFLNKATGELKNLSRNELDKIKQAFSRAMFTANKLFDDYAFRKRFSRKDRKYHLNKALFDSWSVNLARLNGNELEKILDKKELVTEKFIELMKDDKFVKSITTGTGKTQSVKTRFSHIENLLKEIHSS